MLIKGKYGNTICHDNIERQQCTPFTPGPGRGRGRTDPVSDRSEIPPTKVKIATDRECLMDVACARPRPSDRRPATKRRVEEAQGGLRFLSRALPEAHRGPEWGFRVFILPRL